VHFGIIEDEISPMRVLDFNKKLLLVVGKDIVLNINGENAHENTCE